MVAFPSWGGSGVVASELAAELARRGHEVYFLSSAPPARGPAPGVQVVEVALSGHPLFEPPAYGLELAGAIVSLHDRVHLDVVHAHYAMPHALACALAKEMRPSLAVAVTLHGTDVSDHYTVGGSAVPLRWALSRVDAVAVPSEFLATLAMRRFELERAPIRIGNFVDLERFAPLSGEPAEASLIHISNLRRVKRAWLTLEILQGVRRHFPGATLTIVGEGPDRATLREYVRAKKLEDAVSFEEPTLDVAAHLHRARVMLLPSASESFGLAALEALACGVPVVASDVGGLPEVLSEGRGARLVAAADIAGMVDATVDLLRDWKDQSKAARERACEIGQRAPIVDSYFTLYNDIAKRSPEAR